MLKSINVQGTRPAVYPDEAGKMLVSDGTYNLSAAQNVDEQVIALCSLPAGCIPIDFTLIVGDIDSGAGIVVNGGGIAANEVSVDQIMISASTVAQAGGVARSTLFPMVTPAETEKLFGMHITTPPGGALAGPIRGILTYRAEEYGA